MLSGQLAAVRELPARLALPGHRRPGALAPRVDALLEHHARRLDELTAILRAAPAAPPMKPPPT